MLSLKLNSSAAGLKILLLGAHCDDIEIGCGGTILRLVREYTISHLKWIVFTSNSERAREAKSCAELFLQDAKSKEIIIKDLRDGFLPQVSSDVKAYFEEIKGDFQPDLIFTHYRKDLHQDHRLLCDLTWNTFRNHLIFEYEIPKYDGDLGKPNFFVPLTLSLVEEKVQAILGYYGSQKGKQWFDRETFFSLLRIRGMESASATKYAEAFHVRKMVL